MLQEDVIAGVAVVGVEVESVEVIVVMQAAMVTQVGGVVEAEKGIMAVEAVTFGFRALGEGLQEILVSLGSFLEI
jgi:hypothetical protein